MRYFGLIITVFIIVVIILTLTKFLLPTWQYLEVFFGGLIVLALWVVRATALKGGKKVEEVNYTTSLIDFIMGCFLLFAIYVCLDRIAGFEFISLIGDYENKIVNGIIIGIGLGIPYSIFKAICISGSMIKFNLRKMNFMILLNATIYSFFITGFCLEVFYRGFFYPELREFFLPEWLYAAVIIGFIDWLAHLGYFKPNFLFFTSNMVAFTLMGVICCWLYEISGNIIPAVFFHAIVDFMLFFYAASGTRNLVI